MKKFLPLVVVVGGLVGAFLLGSARKAPERRASEERAPLVEVVAAEKSAVDVEVPGHGTVVPRTTVQVVPQVAGRVIEVHPHLRKGAGFERGALLVAIEPVDFELAVERARTAVIAAEVRLEMERAEAQLAREDWQRLHPEEEPPNALVMREPQLRQAEAELDAARSNLEEAEIRLDRTRIVAPFHGRVVSENVDVGQFVAVGQAIAVIYADDVLEVPVPLDDRLLGFFDLGLSGRGSAAKVSLEFGGVRHVWEGRVVRSEGVDPTTRMVSAVVRVEDDFDPNGARPPLLPGMFVDVAIRGRHLDDVVRIPRSALRRDNAVWIAEGGKLRIRPVEVAWEDRDAAWVSRGLDGGEAMVLTALDAVTEGMAIRAKATSAGEQETP